MTGHLHSTRDSRAWRRSSRSASGSNGANCVEVSLQQDIHVRDSKLDTVGEFPLLSLSAAEWIATLNTIKHDQLRA